MNDERRLSRRVLFDEAASLYERVRPRYPQALAEDLANFAGVGPHTQVLEIGCGTGQLTLSLAERGASILAVELGPRLAECARQNLAEFPQVKIVVADFDEWDSPNDFDLVVVATAFHWLDPSTRLRKCVNALRSGGTLAIVETHWRAGNGRDRFFEDSQECYARWDPEYDPNFEPSTLNSLPTQNDELEGSRYFEEIRLNRYIQEQQYGAIDYCDLLRSFSGIRAMDESNRSGFLRCIGQLIESKHNGSILRKDVYHAWLARKHRDDTVFGASES
jgi:SAM-dependent methyltransferase